MLRDFPCGGTEDNKVRLFQTLPGNQGAETQVCRADAVQSAHSSGAWEQLPWCPGSALGRAGGSLSAAAQHTDIPVLGLFQPKQEFYSPWVLQHLGRAGDVCVPWLQPRAASHCQSLLTISGCLVSGPKRGFTCCGVACKKQDSPQEISPFLTSDSPLARKKSVSFIFSVNTKWSTATAEQVSVDFGVSFFPLLGRPNILKGQRKECSRYPVFCKSTWHCLDFCFQRATKDPLKPFGGFQLEKKKQQWT